MLFKVKFPIITFSRFLPILIYTCKSIYFFVPADKKEGVIDPKNPKSYSKSKRTVLEVGSCGTWNQEMDFSRIVKCDSESSIDELNEVPPLECEDST